VPTRRERVTIGTVAPGRVNWRWLTAAGFAVVACVVSILAATSNPTGDSRDEIFSALAWLSAIVAAFCVVRAGFDAGVHQDHRRPDRDRQIPSR